MMTRMNEDVKFSINHCWLYCCDDFSQDFPISHTHTHSLQGGVAGFKLNITRGRGMFYFSLVKRLKSTGYKTPNNDYDNSLTLWKIQLNGENSL